MPRAATGPRCQSELSGDRGYNRRVRLMTLLALIVLLATAPAAVAQDLETEESEPLSTGAQAML